MFIADHKFGSYHNFQSFPNLSWITTFRCVFVAPDTTRAEKTTVQAACGAKSRRSAAWTNNLHHLRLQNWVFFLGINYGKLPERTGKSGF
jgi:hypothetical protein